MRKDRPFVGIPFNSLRTLGLHLQPRLSFRHIRPMSLQLFVWPISHHLILFHWRFRTNNTLPTNNYLPVQDIQSLRWETMLNHELSSQVEVIIVFVDVYFVVEVSANLHINDGCVGMGITYEGSLGFLVGGVVLGDGAVLKGTVSYLHNKLIYHCSPYALELPSIVGSQTECSVNPYLKVGIENGRMEWRIKVIIEIDSQHGGFLFAQLLPIRYTLPELLNCFVYSLFLVSSFLVTIVLSEHEQPL